jgi:hypothetical protein
MFRREIALAMSLVGCSGCGSVTRDHVQDGPAPISPR